MMVDTIGKRCMLGRSFTGPLPVTGHRNISCGRLGMFLTAIVVVVLMIIAMDANILGGKLLISVACTAVLQIFSVDVHLQQNG